MATRTKNPDYPAAFEAAVDIPRQQAPRRQTITYGALSADPAAQGSDSIPPHHGIMTHLLKNDCPHDNDDGRAPMLSALVVNKTPQKKPPAQLSTLARTDPFTRPADWTWQDEQQRVFTHHP
ncbi:hypothetical protein ACIQJ4_30515 [Streptomyces filamentosus]|uniref:hypothetical protein n=1 Tax=Streptomyces filamentosus TaxID=67294 RepID=UPI003827F41C